MEKEYFLAQDQSFHWFIVDAQYEKEWDEWRELDEDDERSWEAPDFAEMLGMAPSKVKFKNYRIV